MPVKGSTKLKTADVVAALNASRGLVTLAADILRINPRTVYKYAAKNKEIKAALESHKSRRLDTAESRLWDAIDGGEAWAICFYLKCQGKARGYIEKAEEKKPDTASTQAATDAQIASALAGAIGRIGKLPPDVAGGPPTQ